MLEREGERILTRSVDPGTLLSSGNDSYLDSSLLTATAFPPPPQRSPRVPLTAVPAAQDIWKFVQLRPVHLENFALLLQTGQTGGEPDHLELLQHRPHHPGSADLGLGVEGLVAVPVVSRALQHLGTTVGGEEGQLRPHPLPCHEELLERS